MASQKRQPRNVTGLIRFTTGVCSLGAVLVATTERGLCALLLGDDREQLEQDLDQRFANQARCRADAALKRHLKDATRWVECPRDAVGCSLDMLGTPFQKRVWKALTQIPAGTTVSYAQLAEAIGQPLAVRAVAQACARNSLGIVVPCHRVVRADGGLGGYRFGVERKRTLLGREVAS